MKIHLVCDAGGCPLHFELSAGQAHEKTSLVDLLNGVDDELKAGTGELVPWPQAIAGDKGYRADGIDDMFVEMGIRPVIPSKKNEDRDSRAAVRQASLSSTQHRGTADRLAEGMPQRLRPLRKTAINFSDMIKMAFIQQYLKILAP